MILNPYFNNKHVGTEINLILINTTPTFLGTVCEKFEVSILISL